MTTIIARSAPQFSGLHFVRVRAAATAGAGRLRTDQTFRPHRARDLRPRSGSFSARALRRPRNLAVGAGLRRCGAVFAPAMATRSSAAFHFLANTIAATARPPMSRVVDSTPFLAEYHVNSCLSRSSVEFPWRFSNGGDARRRHDGGERAGSAAQSQPAPDQPVQSQPAQPQATAPSTVAPTAPPSTAAPATPARVGGGAGQLPQITVTAPPVRRGAASGRPARRRRRRCRR